MFGGGEIAAVPGHDALGVAECGGGDPLAAPAQLGARLADGGCCGGLVTGNGGHAGQAGQGSGNERDDRGAAPAVYCPAEGADGGGGVASGCGEASLGARAAGFHHPHSAASSRGPASPDLRFGRVELANGGEQLRPQAPQGRLGEVVRMRR